MSASRAIKWSIGVGVAVLAAKIVAWRLTGSVALYSDALESIVNVAAAVFAAWALQVAARPPDQDHPWGHGKAEYFSAVVEGVLVVVAAFAIAREAWSRLGSPEPVEQFGLGMLVSLGATAANGALAAYLLRTSQRLRSPALRADGMHLLSDVITTGGVLVGISVAWLTGWWILDPIIALVVAVHIVRLGVGIVRESLGGLMDEALPEAELGRVRDALEREASPWHIEGLRARRAGRRTFVELRLLVAADMSVGESHALCDRLEDAAHQVIDGAEVTVHVEPHD